MNFHIRFLFHVSASVSIIFFTRYNDGRVLYSSVNSYANVFVHSTGGDLESWAAPLGGTAHCTTPILVFRCQVCVVWQGPTQVTRNLPHVTAREGFVVLWFCLHDPWRRTVLVPCFETVLGQWSCKGSLRSGNDTHTQTLRRLSSMWSCCHRSAVHCAVSLLFSSFLSLHIVPFTSYCPSSFSRFFPVPIIHFLLCSSFVSLFIIASPSSPIPFCSLYFSFSS